MAGKPKLELTWIGKDVRPRLEPRILLEEPEKSYYAAHRVTEHDRFDAIAENMSITGLAAQFTVKESLYFSPPTGLEDALGVEGSHQSG